MSHYVWTHERGHDLALRDAKQAPRVLVGQRDDSLYVCCILEPGMIGVPDSGPYKQRRKACEFAQGWVQRNLDPEATFAGMPESVFPKKRALA